MEGWLHKTRLRLKALFDRKALDRNLDDEVAFHLSMREEKNRRAGADPEEARYAAHRQFGNATSLKERSREMRTLASFESVLSDVRFGLRTLCKNPSFSIVAMLTLALGIGANTAMFSLLDQVVLRLLPVSHPEQLVIVTETGNHYGNGYGANTISWPMFEDLRDNNQAFSGMFGRFPATVTIGYGDRAAQIPAELVSGSYFPILGVGAALGRTIAPDDDAVPDSKPVVVLSYSFWRSYFDGDPNIVGRAIALNSHSMTVIGGRAARF